MPRSLAAPHSPTHPPTQPHHHTHTHAYTLCTLRLSPGLALAVPCFCRMLAGDRARQWALSRGLAAAETSGDAAAMHLTAHTQRQWRKYRRIVDGATGDEGSPAVGASPAAHHGRQAAGQGSQQQVVWGQEGQQQGQRMAPRPAKRSRRQSSQREESPRQPQSTQQAASEHAAAQSADGCFYDTVGCVALSPDGRVAAGVSSGGIVLKTEGRVGEAAVFGAGCWAQDGSPGVAPTTAAQQQQQQPGSGAAGPCLACSVTGVGERVMQHLLARELCQAAAAGSAAQAAGTAGSAEGEQRLPAEPAEPAEPGLDEVAALLLHRTILLGPPPHDCGLLCLRALPLGCSSSRERGDSVGPRQGAQRPQQRRVAVEVAVAHSAQSMAVGHLSCAAAACSTHDGAPGAHGRGAPTGAPPPPAPSVHILRRPVDGGGCAAQPVQTYLHGITVHL